MHEPPPTGDKPRTDRSPRRHLHNLTDHRHHDSNKRDYRSKQNEHETVDTDITKNISERTRRRARHREERCINSFDDESSLDGKRAQTAWLPQVHHLVACEVEHAVLVPLVQTQTVEVVIAGHEDDTEPQVIVLEAPKEQFR